MTTCTPQKKKYVAVGWHCPDSVRAAQWSLLPDAGRVEYGTNGAVRCAEHAWTQAKLASFLEFLDTEGITRVGVWCMTDGKDPIGFPCPGTGEGEPCAWQTEELEKWKAKRLKGVR